MNYGLSVWGPLEKLIWRDVLIIVAVLFLARLLILAMQWTLRRAAETARPHRRLTILRIVPIARLLIRAAVIEMNVVQQVRRLLGEADRIVVRAGQVQHQILEHHSTRQTRLELLRRFARLELQ